jgi:hypothetical protein
MKALAMRNQEAMRRKTQRKNLRAKKAMMRTKTTKKITDL